MAAAPPVLTVTASVDPAAVATAGQRLAYTVVVTNTGGSALKDAVVSLVAADLAPLVCVPVPQGGTLAASASTRCTGSRTSTQDDLAHSGRLSATAAGQAPDGTPVTASTSVTLTPKTVAPVVTDDSVRVAAGTRYVDLPASTNDSPGEAGGPALDLGRTLLTSTSPSDAGTRRRPTSGGVWEALADGSVRFTPGATGVGRANTTPYVTFDTAGRSTRGTLTVVVSRAPVARPDTATTPQGVSVRVDVLANDTAGQAADGTPATLDLGSLRFTDDQPVGGAQVGGDGQTLTIPQQGSFSASSGYVTFSPASGLATIDGHPLTIRYSVADRIGNLATSTVAFTVTPVPVTAADVSATTRYLSQAELSWAPHATPGVRLAGFVSRDGTNFGTGRTTAQGSWYYLPPNQSGNPGAPVEFFPAVGFSGTASTLYQVVDANGTTATASMSVLVRRGGAARPDVASTRPGVDVTVDPLANDVPAQRLDGTPAGFDLNRLVFSDGPQPQGAVRTDHGKSLVLPGQGSAWISNGKVTFRPQSGFVGSVGRLSLDAPDDGGPGGTNGAYPYGVVDTVAVLVTSSSPTATDDLATTVIGHSVTLPASTNDDPGTAPTPLATTFPTTGQPSGSTVSSDGRTLREVGQGTWLVRTDGTVTFTPVPGFTGGTSPVRYRVAGAGGSSATASLAVSVAAGPYAASDVISRSTTDANPRVDPIANDSPGRNADGTLGTLDPLSVRFPATGQPAGAIVSADGTSLSLPAQGSAGALNLFTEADTGLVYVSHNGTVPAVSYTVTDSVTDSAGVVLHHTSTATLQLLFVGRDPVATDDTATITQQDSSARLAGATNDVPGSSGIYAFQLPLDQLPGLPRNSTIEYVDTGGGVFVDTARIPGEGIWEMDPYDGFITFYPTPGFVGTTTPLRYRVEGYASGSDEATVRVTVLPPPTLVADTATTRQGVPVTLQPLADDRPGRTIGGSSVALDPDALGFTALPTGASLTPTGAGKELVVPGEGRYSIANVTGLVTFTPEPGFSGTTTSVHLAELGSSSPLRVTVTTVTPVANADLATVARSSRTRVPLLDNDVAGAAGVPLRPSTLRFASSGLPVGATRTSDGQVVLLPGRGILTAAGDGTVGWFPSSSSTAALPAVTYEVADANGTEATARLTLTTG